MRTVAVALLTMMLLLFGTTRFLATLERTCMKGRSSEHCAFATVRSRLFFSYDYHRACPVCGARHKNRPPPHRGDKITKTATASSPAKTACCLLVSDSDYD